MAGSFFARRIKEELSKAIRGVPDTVDRAQLVEWFHQYDARKEFTAAEAEELRTLLELGPDLSKFSNLITDGWFADVLDTVRDTESPRPFFVLAGMAVLGNLVGRRVVIDRGTHRVCVGPCVLIISPAGETRRSTACDFMVYELGKPAGLNYIADSFSYEAFGDALSELQDKQKAANALIYAGEMSVLLGKGSYGESMIPKLTDILGKMSPFHWRTVKRGQVTIREPMVTALLTTAPDWLAEHIPAVAFGGGFASRFLMCVQERREKIVPWADAIPETRMLQLAQGLKRCTAANGSFSRPEGPALDWYTSWYIKHSERLDFGEVSDERLRPYLSRKHDHLLRLAAVLTLANQEPLKFTTKRLEQALALLDWLEVDVPKAYSAMALTPQAVACRGAVKALEGGGGTMLHSELHKRIYRQCPMSSHFKEVMQSLMDLGAVQETKDLSGRGKNYVLRFNRYE